MTDRTPAVTDFDVLNSLTKYPSIPTYHELDPQTGCLDEGAMAFPSGAILTEKVNGASGRVIVMPDGDWLIGSREEILFARGDRIVNPQLGIVTALLRVAPWLVIEGSRGPVVYYLEVYGHRVGGEWKNYTTGTETGARLFDIAFIPSEALALTREEAASWRQHGGQQFAHEEVLTGVAAEHGLDIVPRLATMGPEDLPLAVADVPDWLEENVPRSLVTLSTSGRGRPEGIVIRSPDRSRIAKARFQDYERTLRKRAEDARLGTRGLKGAKP